MSYQRFKKSTFKSLKKSVFIFLLSIFCTLFANNGLFATPDVSDFLFVGKVEPYFLSAGEEV